MGGKRASAAGFAREPVVHSVFHDADQQIFRPDSEVLQSGGNAVEQGVLGGRVVEVHHENLDTDQLATVDVVVRRVEDQLTGFVGPEDLELVRGCHAERVDQGVVDLLADLFARLLGEGTVQIDLYEWHVGPL